MPPKPTRRKPASPRPRRPRRVLLALDYYMHQVHQGVVDYARQAGWMLDARPQHQRQLPVGWQADGVLTFIGSEDLFGKEIRATGLPVVNMSPWGKRYNIPSVQSNNVQAGAVAAEHLISRGITQLAMVQFSPTSLTSRARRDGFESTVKSSGRTFHSLVCPREEEKGATPGQMLQWLGESLARLPRPCGVFTEGDLWAVEIIHLCPQLSLRVPEDIAVVGIDNDPMVVDVAPVPVSSVDNNLHGLGVQAASLLDRLMSGEPAPSEPILVDPRGVVQRRSTNVIAVSNEDVAAAMAFIDSHFREPITVADVARETNISRRRLQDLFLQHVGRSISEEIMRSRLDLAKRLLMESPMKIGQIAERSGLGNGVQMAKVFARHLKTTPKEYRLQNTPTRRH